MFIPLPLQQEDSAIRDLGSWAPPPDASSANDPLDLIEATVDFSPYADETRLAVQDWSIPTGSQDTYAPFLPLQTLSEDQLGRVDAACPRSASAPPPAIERWKSSPQRHSPYAPGSSAFAGGPSYPPGRPLRRLRREERDLETELERERRETRKTEEKPCGQ